MSTVIDLITAALQDLQELQAGETPDADAAAVGLSRLNDWLDANKNENLLVFTITRTTWALVASTASYTVGSGGTLNIARPVSPQDVLNVGYYDTTITPNDEILFDGLLSDAAFEVIPQKSLTSTYPQAAYYNPTYSASGLGTLTLWPVPTGTTLRGVIYTKTPVDEFTALSDEILLPPGYRRFLRTNLAIELASAFGLPVPPQVATAARDAGIRIKSKNVRTDEMSTPLDACQYDINSDATIIRR